MYACGMERNADRTYVSTWVGLETEAASPRVELVSCENKVKKKQRNNIKSRSPELGHEKEGQQSGSSKQVNNNSRSRKPD